jgi:hypothetical protein
MEPQSSSPSLYPMSYPGSDYLVRDYEIQFPFNVTDIYVDIES